MPCYHPLEGWRSREVNPDTGKRSIVFDIKKAFHDLPTVTLQCGQCIGCRLEYSRQWAIRLSHEAQLYEDNSFITLTYSQEHLPKSNSLELKDFQDFMKRLRKKFEPRKLRFFHAGEYGEQTKRPHYHAILFNLRFPDQKYERMRGEHRVYSSQMLEELWGLGRTEIGTVTFESAAYVARYICEKNKISKATKPEAVLHFYEKYQAYCDLSNAELTLSVKPEYATMSRRPGLGRGWIDKFHSDVYPWDYVVTRDGKKFKPPKFYDRYFELVSPQDFMRLKYTRVDGAKSDENNTLQRLATREKIKIAQYRTLKRNLSDDP